MPRLPILALLLASLALAGCGAAADSASEFEGTERDVADAIESLEEAGAEDEPRTICNSLLASALLEQIEERGADCVEEVDRALSQADSFSLTVESIRLTGDDAARAQVETGADEEQLEIIELVRENDTWRVSALPGAA